MEKLCIKYFRVGSLEFFTNNGYKVEFNPVDKQIYLYNVWGCVRVPKLVLDAHFL